MSRLEALRNYLKPRPETGSFRRANTITVVSYGAGAGCNKEGEPSCIDFCNVPSGKKYNPAFDPPIESVAELFSYVAKLKPSIVSIVPDGEAVNIIDDSNTRWSIIDELGLNGFLTTQQVVHLKDYVVKHYHINPAKSERLMKPAEKIALSFAIAKKTGLNVSFTTNGSFLTKDLLELYAKMGLEAINLSYHPNLPFNPIRYNPDLEQLMDLADNAIENGIIPTITHVLTKKNADTFISLADLVTERDIFFAVGVADGKGPGFSKFNALIEPTPEQKKMIFRRLLARKLFADRHIRTSSLYLLLMPYMNPWFCEDTMDFMHIGFDKVNGKFKARLNTCSEVRPKTTLEFKDFFVDGHFDENLFSQYRQNAMDKLCRGCQSQCYFEGTTHNLDITDLIQIMDTWDTFGKGWRSVFTARHPLRPTVSLKKDFQNYYLWESLLQGIPRQIAAYSRDPYWQRTFKRAKINIDQLIESLIQDATDPSIITGLILAEEKEFSLPVWQKPENEPAVVAYHSQEWHDAFYIKSKLLRALYSIIQEDFAEEHIIKPLKFSDWLKRVDTSNLRQNVNLIRNGTSVSKSVRISKKGGRIFPFIIFLLYMCYRLRGYVHKKIQQVYSRYFLENRSTALRIGRIAIPFFVSV